MIGLGTVINTAAVVVGGFVGLFVGKLLKERFRTALMTACGISVLFIGLGGVFEKMLTVGENGLVAKYSALICGCLVLGTFFGELLNIERGFERLGEWLKRKTKSEHDTGFVNGFLIASLTVPVFVLEGLMTLLAFLIKPLMTDLALDYVALIGSILIFCVGLNLIRDRQIRVANMLPSIILAVICAFLPL